MRVVFMLLRAQTSININNKRGGRTAHTKQYRYLNGKRTILAEREEKTTKIKTISNEISSGTIISFWFNISFLCCCCCWQAVYSDTQSDIEIECPKLRWYRCQFAYECYFLLCVRSIIFLFWSCFYFITQCSDVSRDFGSLLLLLL